MLPIHPDFLIDDGINEDYDGINGGVKHINSQEDMINELIYGGVNGGINDGISDGISDGINEIVLILLNTSGRSAIEIARRIDKSLPTAERYIRKLRKIAVGDIRE